MNGERSAVSDSCSYTIHLGPSFKGAKPPQGSHTDSGRRLDLDQASLQAEAARILDYAESLAPDYIWQRAEGLSLHPIAASAATNDSPRALSGTMRLGESIEDEWFIVWLLLKISQRWTDAVISIKDNDDGQFLLIEAAEALPPWLTPANAENRMWISGGQFHLVPLQHTSPVPVSLQDDDNVDSRGYISVEDAVACVRDPSIDSMAPQTVCSAITARISGLPHSLATTHFHKTIAYLPEEIAMILQMKPRLISQAVGAFYERDALQLRSCQFMSKFPPRNTAATRETTSQAGSRGPAPAVAGPGSGCRYTNVRMTRALYAQLMSQKFYPPKPFLKAGCFEGLSEGSQEHRWREVGMKIACGFEMLYAAASFTSSRTRVDLSRGPTSRQDALRSQQPHLKYIVALTDAGYFQGEAPGSRLYAELEDKANAYWEEIQASGSEEGRSVDFKQACDAALEKARSNGQVGDSLTSDHPAKDSLSEDSDEWLYLSQAGLENIFRTKGGTLDSKQGPAHAPNIPDDEIDAKEADDMDDDERLAQEQAKRLQDIADRFGNFVNAEGDVDGALFDDEAFSDDDGSDDEDDMSDNMQAVSSEMDGDILAGSSKHRVMSESEKADRMEKLVKPLDTSEWGAAAAVKAKELNTPKRVAGDQTSEMTGVAAVSKSPGKHMKPTFKDEYDGVSDDSSDDGDADQEERLSTKQTYELEDLDDAQIEEDEGLQFGPEEMEDFLKFTREALGLSEDQYNDILRVRKERGSFVPGDTSAKPVSGPSRDTSEMEVDDKGPKKPKFTKATRDGPRKDSAPAAQPRNPKLDNFEALMNAMDAELTRVKTAPIGPSSSSSQAERGAQSKTASRAPLRKSVSGAIIEEDATDSEEEEGEERDEYMDDLDAELDAALKRDPDLHDGEGNVDYAMISNFLESFKAQAGLAGPVSNIFGRLDKDFKLPRDET